ncbi:patatin-like phospholipase family protein [Agrobacterium vitis]|nr:patatin-like phospholipase family protein [Agrobacterium vitis]
MTGLALSGGGIRSAAFSLGAMQALHAHDALDKFDYLSTVSGGGYLGAAVSAGMSKNDGKFPFATGKDDIRDSDSVGHLRNFSNYLMPRNRSFIRNVGDAAAILLRGVVSNAVMIAPFLLLAGMLSAFLWTSSNGFRDQGFVETLFGLAHPYPLRSWQDHLSAIWTLPSGSSARCSKTNPCCRRTGSGRTGPTPSP